MPDPTAEESVDSDGMPTQAAIDSFIRRLPQGIGVMVKRLRNNPDSNVATGVTYAGPALAAILFVGKDAAQHVVKLGSMVIPETAVATDVFDGPVRSNADDSRN